MEYSSRHASQLHGQLISDEAYLQSLRSASACTAVLSRLARSRRPGDAFSLFSLLRLQRLLPEPNAFTFSAILPACASSSSSGSQLHSLALKHGVAFHLFVSSALARMYARSSDAGSAKRVFDEMPLRNLVSWNSLIVGYLHNCLFHEAISAFRDLLRLPAHPLLTKPDQVTFSSVLSACANSGELSFGLGTHALAVKSLLDSLPYVKNSLINMYSKCGRVDDARKLFDAMLQRDAVAWNTMMAGFVQIECYEEACRLFLAMRSSPRVKVDEVSFSTVLHGVANLAELLLGAQIHCQAAKLGFAENRCISSSLITAYSRCGSLSDAQLVFFAYAKDQRNVVSWTAMIAALQQHGHADRVLYLFEEMLLVGLQPDHVTFVCVLSACSHAGLVEKGFQYFHSMTIAPGNEHYACMVDMLGRAGRLDDAKRFIEEMPAKPGASVWGALLGACRNRQNLEMGKEVAHKLFEMEPHNSGNYVLLSNMYASHGKMKEANEVRRAMGMKGVRKEMSCSWIDVRSRTHVFTVRDRSHGSTEEIYEMLKKLEGLAKEKGYAPDAECAVNDTEGYKEQGLMYHSERLALAFGLLTLSPEAEQMIRIKKNLRTCGDCHNFIKLVSGLLQKHIILRDAHRFHHFVDGSCSCKDYW